MQTETRIKAGDFTQLAHMYSQYRPGYSETVLKAILGVINQPPYHLDFVDVGAGTGIWTRTVAKTGCNSVIAVEPNDAMRKEGKLGNGSLAITWLAGSAEKIGLPSESADLLSMASSFHWADFYIATQEIHRVLKSGGYFLVLWNPRYLENNSLLLDIESYISQLEPNISRISSGKSKHVNELAKKLAACSLFEDMIYLEGLHTATLSKEQYIGIWKSVNDVRTQLGEERFATFLDYIDHKIHNASPINCSYQTRAWLMRKK